MKKWLMIIFIHSNCKYCWSDRDILPRYQAESANSRPVRDYRSECRPRSPKWNIFQIWEKFTSVQLSRRSKQPTFQSRWFFILSTKEKLSMDVGDRDSQICHQHLIVVINIFRLQHRFNLGISNSNSKKMWMLLRRWMSLSNELDNNWIPWSISRIDSE